MLNVTLYQDYLMLSKHTCHRCTLSTFSGRTASIRTCMVADRPRQTHAVLESTPAAAQPPATGILPMQSFFRND